MYVINVPQFIMQQKTIFPANEIHSLRILALCPLVCRGAAEHANWYILAPFKIITGSIIMRNQHYLVACGHSGTHQPGLITLTASSSHFLINAHHKISDYSLSLRAGEDTKDKE